MATQNNVIEKRLYMAIEVKLASPLSIGSGISDFTDSDVMSNGDGEIFVPGTSLAGAFRDYLGEEKNKEDEKNPNMMGFANGDKGRMSSLFISDLYFDKNAIVSVRDGVQLDDDKRVKKGSKFDMQIVETGATGVIYLQWIVRTGNDAEVFNKNISSCIKAIHSGDVRIGANKNRGFGRLEIERIYSKSFEKEQVDDWIAFQANWKTTASYGAGMDFSEWEETSEEEIRDNYIHIKVPLNLTGGISIRRYSAEPGKADFEHITCNGNPVIPGSSWNGAIRADVKSILRDLGIKDSEDENGKSINRIKQIMDQWFGCVGEESKQSLIVVGESVIENATPLPMTRNKINRFDASTISGALYSEVAYFGGTTTLDLMIRKSESPDDEYRALLAVLDIVIQDIQEGFVPVGGQTAIGRGIFAKNGDVDWGTANREGCVEALKSLCSEGK